MSADRPGPTLRTDIVDVYVFRAANAGSRPEFLQLLRAEAPLRETWQPVMGHVERSESTVHAALRELEEETGLSRLSTDLQGFWSLEQVHPYFLPESDAIVLSPRFAAAVTRAWTPRLSDEHRDHRWVAANDVPGQFMWPGQHAACREIETCIAPLGAPARVHLAIEARTIAR